MIKNLYSGSAEYYDLLVDKKEINKEVSFISKLLKKYDSKSILDLACGTGLYLIPLKKKGFDVEGLDLSKEMLKQVRKKDREIKVYLKDMSDFKIKKKFDSIVCLSSSLIILPNLKTVNKAIKNIFSHLNKEGILILDLPNHNKEIRERDGIPEKDFKKFLGGVLNSNFLSYKKGRKWVEKWFGEVKKGSKVLHFEDTWEEIIYSPLKIEKSLKKSGFKIMNLYGSMTGNKFDKNKSWRRVYLCQKLGVEIK